MFERALALVLIATIEAGSVVVGTPARAATVSAPMAATCTSPTAIPTSPPPPPPADQFPRSSGYHGKPYTWSAWPTLCPGDKTTLEITYVNTGDVVWDGLARLGTSWYEPGQDQPSIVGGDGQKGSPATGWLNYNRPAAQSPSRVAPGEYATFRFTVQAPTTPGIYVVGLRPLVEGVTWLEDYGAFWAVTVLNADGSHPGYACKQCWPLSGGFAQGGALTRRPLSVRIDNVIPARPHYGLSDADQVWEFLVEGFVTRLNAVFHRSDPAVIGGVRSARLSDRYLTPGLKAALGYSGASGPVLTLIRGDVANGNFIDAGDATGAGDRYYRVDFRVAPYNLFTTTGGLRSYLDQHGWSGPVSVPPYTFQLDLVNPPQDATGMRYSIPASVLSIPYRAGVDVRYQYDAASRTYARWQAGDREVDAANGRAIAARNVVIIYTDIWLSDIVEDILGSRGLDMRLTGTGKCSVFRDGRRQDCNWSRATIFDQFTFTNFTGDPIMLSPGQTWFHVVPTDWQVPSS